MNPMPENQPIEPLEPMNNNPSGKSRIIMKPLYSNRRGTEESVRNFLVALSQMRPGRIDRYKAFEAVENMKLPDWQRAAWLIISLSLAANAEIEQGFVLSKAFNPYIRYETFEVIRTLFGYVPIVWDMRSESGCSVKGAIQNAEVMIYFRIFPRIIDPDFNDQDMLVSSITGGKYKITGVGGRLEFRGEATEVSLTWSPCSIFPEFVSPDELIPIRIRLRRFFKRLMVQL
jgi:hypothetical protein